VAAGCQRQYFCRARDLEQAGKQCSRAAERKVRPGAVAGGRWLPLLTAS
jgi:hypothetical protein